MTAPRVPSSVSTAGALVAAAALLTACSSAPAPSDGQAQQTPARPGVVTMDERAAGAGEPRWRLGTGLPEA